MDPLLDAVICPSQAGTHGMKTNAVRLLDELGVRYELREYLVDEDDLSAAAVAAKIALPPAQVFKTLAARGDVTGVILAVVPGDAELDLKALGRLSGNRKVELAPVVQLQALTGYIRGGVTALACKKPYPVFLHASASRHPVISISAGKRGLQILLAPGDYIRAVSATVGKIARPFPSGAS
jgi:Cys-tRNA(Pro)/Cys-tRNA(Cys) deacylase